MNLTPRSDPGVRHDGDREVHHVTQAEWIRILRMSTATTLQRQYPRVWSSLQSDKASTQETLSEQRRAHVLRCRDMLVTSYQVLTAPAAHKDYMMRRIQPERDQPQYLWRLAQSCDLSDLTPRRIRRGTRVLNTDRYRTRSAPPCFKAPRWWKRESQRRIGTQPAAIVINRQAEELLGLL